MNLIPAARLHQMIATLDAMSVGAKTSPDGLGKYLGDGIVRPNGVLRTVELRDALAELVDRRQIDFASPGECG